MYPQRFNLFFFLISMTCSSMLFAGVSNKTEKNQDVFEVIQSRIQKDFESRVNIKKIVEKIPEHIEKYNSEIGSFEDVDYKSRVWTNWPPLVHVLRLYDLTYAYTIKEKDNPYFEDPEILNIIEKGLDYWCSKDANSENWWYNEVGEPHKTGIILIQLREAERGISSEIENKVLARLKNRGGSPLEWTGANKTDIALHWMYRACLTKDKDLLDIALSEGYYPIQFIPFDEGLQPDFSFFQHGPQLYIGGYGDELLKGVLMFADYTSGTQYALDKEKLAIIRNFALHTYYKVIRGSYIHMNVIGRGMSRENETKKNPLFAEKLMKIDPDYAAKYETIAKRIKGEISPDTDIEPINTTYYIGDYVAHVRPKYAAGVRTVSTRTMRSEYGNGENVLTYFLSDGSMHLTQEGDEYYNIFPLWDWSHLPGVTNPYLLAQDIPRTKINWQTPGTESFVGGASDSLYSVNTYRLDDKFAGINTSANKSWFFFDEEIVCLGSGITSTSDFTINTTVEQNRLKGDIVMCSSDNKLVRVAEGDYEHHHENTLKWVLHNDRGYIFPNKGNVLLKSEIREGKWHDINNTQSDRKVSESVFTLWFDHGYKPKEEKYEYIIVPNKSTPSEMENYNIDNIQICENSDSVQAVYHKELNLLGLVFLRHGEFSLGGMIIKSDKPSAMLVKGLGTSKVTFHISDPAQSKEVLKFKVHIPTISSEDKEIVMDLRNSNISAGKTYVYQIE